MHQLNFSKLESLAPDGLGSIAIETGTFQGRATRALAEKFSRVFTIELSPELYREAKGNLAPFSHVECLQGNSAEVLAQLLPTFPKDGQLFLFLDAHWSGDSSVNWKNSEWKGYGRDTAHAGKSSAPSGPEQCPLLEELAAIAKHWSGSAHILIDDTKNIPERGPGRKNFCFQGEDWSHLSRQTVMESMGTRLKSFQLLENPEQYFLSISAR